MAVHRLLKDDEIHLLEASGCTAEAWTQVRVGDGFDAARVRNVRFVGAVTIGALGENPAGGPPPGLDNATLEDCEIGSYVRIARSRIVRMRVGDGVRIEDVGELVTHPGATFGNGIEVEPANESGARELPLFDRLSSGFAHLYLFYRSVPGLKDALKRLVDERVATLTADYGDVGEGAVVTRVQEMVNVRIGPRAEISGALVLRNGTILSEERAPTRVGAGVIAEDFIIAEGATVDGTASLSKTYVGQATRVGRQFSAENCLFFANSECFHGEAVAVFGGPYTVTHHKSTLLIAGTFSFYNAGSGTNQSNHMYKLGPVHQGVLERGSKTGTLSYLLWPSAIGPYSVVIGKHMTNLDTRDLPFSYITEEHGESVLTPAMNMHTVGTVRDAAKWPTRDRRTASTKRDQIRFELYGPYVVGKMIRGERVLLDLYEATPKEIERVRFNGVTIKRLMLRHTARHYARAIDTYVKGKILERIPGDGREATGNEGPTDGTEAAATNGNGLAGTGLYSEAWADVGGLQIGRKRLDALISAVVAGTIETLDAFEAAVRAANDAYEDDEWAWVRRVFEKRTGQAVEELTADDVAVMRADHDRARASALKKVLADAANEFSETARYGYGDDGGPNAADADFGVVRGHLDDNAFVKGIQRQLEAIGAN